MLKNIFEKMIQQDPDEKHRYVFINDNMEIMQNAVILRYGLQKQRKMHSAWMDLRNILRASSIQEQT